MDEVPEQARAPGRSRVRPGKPYPLGATWDGLGVNFALYASHADRVELALFDHPDDESASEAVLLVEQTGPIWHCYIPHLRPGQLYGYRETLSERWWRIKPIDKLNRRKNLGSFRERDVRDLELIDGPDLHPNEKRFLARRAELAVHLP